MDRMTIDGYEARIEYDADIQQFRGEILGLNGGADFYGGDADELREAFGLSLAVFLSLCQEKGIEPLARGAERHNNRDD